MIFTSASEPDFGGKMPHLLCAPGDIAPVVLLPGDPGRVEMFPKLCDDFRILSRNREYTVGSGTYRGMPVTVCSTGIGGPSTEIAVLELIALGAKALIRIGGTGAIKEEIACSDIILNTAAMRMGGASQFYAEPEYPAVASFETVECLKQACEEEHLRCHMGICASVGSFYRGQGRTPPGQRETDERNVLEKYRRLNILNLEMEAETIFTLASLYGVYSGSICTVHCNRMTDQWLLDNEDSQRQMCKAALSGALLLYKKYLQEK